MRNLRNNGRSTIKFVDAEAAPLAAVCWDASNCSLICAFGPTESTNSVELRRLRENATCGEVSTSIASWEAQCSHPDLKCDKIISLHCFSDAADICLIFAGGDIVVVREQATSSQELLEIVGTVDAGIEATGWSPDEELFVVATKAKSILLMSREFDVVADVSLSPEDARLSKHVNVGWGKKETQFHGKRAKALRDPTMPDKVDEGLLSTHDYGEVTVSWRGDGKYFAVNSIDQGSRRMVRVYSRDGVLDSVGEPVDFLEGALSWSRNLITGIQRKEDVTQVVFLERNGLRHGEFSLRLPYGDGASWTERISVNWNVDYTVLAVSFNDRIQLWTTGNYHYYLKQEVHMSHSSQRLQPLDVRWHPEKPLRLAVHNGEQIKVLDYCFNVARGSTSPPHDFGAVAVIDGSTLRVTPLRTATIPPPMALHEIGFDAQGPIVDVAFNEDSSLIGVLHADQISIVKYDPCSRDSQPELVRAIHFGPNQVRPCQIASVGGTDFYCLVHHDDHNTDSIQAFRDVQIAIEGPYPIPISERVPSRLSSIFSRMDRTAIYYPDAEGVITQIGGSTSSLPTVKRALSLWVDIAGSGNACIVFNLTYNGKLYADSRELATNCTSFLLTPVHLILTTTQNMLKFVHLTNAEDLELPPDEPETDERCRNIERGARLVTVIPSTYSLVLQMPRGNLEVIYPRALVLAGIRNAIETKDYRTAFFACRNQRVDMNLLHDYAPRQFMDNVLLFITQIERVEHIDLFLSQLRQEDVSKTLYKDTLSPPKTRRFLNGGSVAETEPLPVHGDLIESGLKVNRICDAFLSILRDSESTNLQNIITANVCKSPPDLEGGLRVISKLRVDNGELAGKAAEHICFLADVNQLYDCALGLYDLDLTLLIAQQSQKDPREYLPYLQDLQEMELLRRMFTIDHDLGRKTKALRHLHDMGAIEELKAYTVTHELYSAAIELCKYQDDHLQGLTRLHAAFLNSRNCFKDAGIAYEFLGDYAAAVPAYKSANLWRESLSCATLIPLPEPELRSLAYDLAEGLFEAKDYQSAAIIHADYIRDVDSACRLYCKASLFADAMRVAGLHRRPDLLETVIDAGLVEGFNSTTELLADCKGQLAAQVPRIHELRVKKAQDPLAFFGGNPSVEADGDGDVDVPDNVSLAPTDASTSGGTFLTRYTARTNGTLNTQTTRRTSKNRRREERKRARGKKGSVYEEEYLVNSVGRLVERVNGVAVEVGRLVEGLMRRGMRERAVAVENAMVEVTQRCKESIAEVFRSEEAKAGMTGEEIRPKGADAVPFDPLNRDGQKEMPLVKTFERLALLT